MAFWLITSASLDPVSWTTLIKEALTKKSDTAEISDS